jgi:hypothetical protein
MHKNAAKIADFCRFFMWFLGYNEPDMIDFYTLFTRLFDWFQTIPFAYLLLFSWGIYALLAFFTLLYRLWVRKKSTSQRSVFMGLTAWFSVFTFVIFAFTFPVPQSVLAACLFYIVGSIISLLLSLVPKQKGEQPQTIRYLTQKSAPSPLAYMQADLPVANADVRLDHALSITERLLAKSMGRGDRQEVEKIRSTLSVLQIKGTLSPEEGEILNDSFNTLLKLMAKYNL